MDKKVMKGIQLDDSFNTQMKKVQTAVEKLGTILDDMHDMGIKITGSQKHQLEIACSEFKLLSEKAGKK